MTKCRVLIEGWAAHSGAEWSRKGYCDLTADWLGKFGFNNGEVHDAMIEFDMHGVERITLVDP